MPRVSIGMPAFNGENFAGQAIESISAQDYPDLELIISDILSTDAIAEICLGYAAHDP